MQASSVMEERLRFVARLLDGEAMTEVCREFGISRKTGYKIFDRYKEHGLEALSDRSRRPVRYANQLPQQVETLIVRLKRRSRTGAPARSANCWCVASTETSRFPPKAPFTRCSTATAWSSAAAGRVTRARGTPLSEGALPNDLWCADFKGEFKLGNGRYCYPLTVTDHASRFLLLCEALDSTREDPPLRPLSDCSASAVCRLPSAPIMACPLPVRMPCSISQSCRCGGSGSVLRSSVSNQAIPNKMVATSACILRSKGKRPGRRGSTACSSRIALTASCTSSMRSGPTRLST